MSKQYPGGLITKNPVVPSGSYSNSTAPGIWTLDQQAYWQKLGQWPNVNNQPIDPQFNYVTMLLHGDGTNGAQNNTFLDSSTNNFTITRNGNTTQGSFSPYGSNWSNFFNGSTSFLTAPASSNFVFTGDYTIEAWLYITGFPDNGGIFSTYTGGGGSLTTSFQFNYETTGTLYCADKATPAGVITLNNWIHVAASRSGTTQKIFVNGVVQSTATVSGTASQASTVYIGKRIDNTNYIQGYISNLRVVNGTAVYTSNFTPSTAPLTAITNTVLLTCQSNRFRDASTNNFAITATGSPSVQRFNPFGASTAYSTSVIGGSGYFDGTGDGLTAPGSGAFSFGTGDFTIETWIYPNAAPASNAGIVDNRPSSGASANAFLIYISNGGFIYYFSNSTNILTGSYKINTWTHVAVTRSSGSLRLFINGTISGSPVSDSINLTDTSFIAGNTYDSFGFNGYMSDVRLVKGTAVYTSNFTPPTAPLTAITNTSILLNTTNGAIFDNAMMNDLETAGNAQISTSVVKYGTGSMYFDGTSDWLSILNTPTSTPSGTESWTIEGWIYPTTASGSLQTLYTNGYPVQIFLSNGSVVIYISSAAGSGSYVINGLAGPASSVSANVWTHFAVVKNANTYTVYVNGVGGTSGTSSTAIAFPSATNATIGDAPVFGSYPYTGYIDDFRITKGYARYTANFTPPTAAFFNYGPN